MARYTKKDNEGHYYIETAGEKHYTDIWGHLYGEAINSFAELENADVVPKSEVEKIFEEIERHIYYNFRISKEESTFGECSTDYLKGRIDMGNDIERLISKLKIKYTEEYKDEFKG